jgi:hypothetical protein
MNTVARLRSDGVLFANLFDEFSSPSRNVSVDQYGVFYSNTMKEGIFSELTNNTPMRIVNNKDLRVYNYFDELTGVSDVTPPAPAATYSIVSGTKLPIYGTGGGAYPPTGSWTGIQNVSADDAFLTISLPFTFYIAGTGYTTTYMGSNTYLTFSAGSTEYGNAGPLGATRPPYPKFHFGSADNSYQRVSRFAFGTDYQRIRYEGTAATGGTVGSPNIVLEITLFNPSVTGGNNVLELLVGNHSRLTGARMVASATTQYATYTLSQNQSYVFEGNSDGTSWTIYTGYNVNY